MPVRELKPEQVLERVAAGARLIDIRAAQERAGGMATPALSIEAPRLHAELQRMSADRDTEIILLCQRGTRSQAAGLQLVESGYRDVASVAGGTQAWREAGLPMQLPPETAGGLDANALERYSRHLRLPEVGSDGQRRLLDASVLLVGAGGLGSPAAFYLAAAGVGRLRIVDDDVVDRSNLQRQILHTDARVGAGKAQSAARTLAALNPTILIEPVHARLSDANVDALLHGMDVVIDGADNFPTRYLLNAACIRHALPLVYGAVHRFEGQVSVFDAGRNRGIAPCYRCLFAMAARDEDAPNCSEAGVLGVLPGVIGLLQATEAIKLILGIGEPLSGRLLQFDAMALRFHETRLAPDPDCPACGRGPGAGAVTTPSMPTSPIGGGDGCVLIA
ncbi:MAG TPA: molybdopterin-synthase adenylyltransferase MoeB [Xanthomonadaceae bacterium]|nr:molybdopterin-synthase adenylyltransferase MoeB [Xanthomonadaceae bacterium]